MTRLRMGIAGAVLGFGLVGAVANTQDRQLPLQSGQVIPRLELEAFVDGVVSQAMATEHIAGVSLAIVQDSNVALTKGYGFADVATARRVDPHTTIFRIGSITKTFTWMAVMNAVEGGRIGLNDPVNTHLPADLQIPDEGFAEPLRIRHLMTHATGFEDRALGHLFETEVSEVRPLRVYLAEERPHRVHEPGVVYSYSNYGVALAGAILEQIHRRPWQEIIEREVIAPLGMAHTSGREPYPARTDLPEPLPAPLAALLAHGYRWRDGHHEMRPFNFVTQGAPAGAMSSTAADMARYMLLLLNGGTFEGVQVFGPATAQALGTPMTSFPRVVGNVHAGFFENQLPGGFSGFGHGGDVISFFSNMVIVPDLRMGIFVTTNTQGGGRLTGVLPLRIVERFYASAQQPPSASTALAASANAYDGYYLPTRRPSEGLQAFLFRLLASRVRVTPDGYLLLRMMGPPRRFVPSEDRDVFTSIESDGFPQAVRFVRAGGRAIRVETPVVALERVALLLQPPVLMSTAAATLLLSLATLLGVRRLFGRAMTALPSAQRVASWLQLAAAITWLVSAGAFAVAALAVLPDETVLLYEWPMHSMLVFSAAALVASLLTAVMMVAAPAVWRSSPTGWTIWRKLRYMATSVVFGACAALLTVWGALQPWNP